jgi:hypothetical protein
MPVRERLKKVLLAVIVEVYRPPGPDVLKVENDVERPGCALQELQDLVPGRPRDREVLASNAHDQMGTAQLFPRHHSQPSRGTPVDLTSKEVALWRPTTRSMPRLWPASRRSGPQSSGSPDQVSGASFANGGDFLLAGCVIRGTSPGARGGIGNFGSLTVSGSTISGNSSREGAGGIDNSGTLLDNNVARDLWGGIYNGGSLTLRRTQVRDNRVVLGGIGGIGNDGTAAIVESAISGNGGGASGGISNGGTLQLLRSTISGNDGFESGGIASRGTLEFDNGTYPEGVRSIGQPSRWPGTDRMPLDGPTRGDPPSGRQRRSARPV